jgi:drug/metabolite transporter (DMT)-like permease
LTAAAATAAAPWRTQALLLAIMLTWGLNIVAVKALTTRIEEIWVATLRMVVASLVLTVCLLARDRRLPRLDGRQLTGLALAALLMVYLNQLLFSHGMVLSTASGASLVMALSPALSLLLSAIVFRERLTLLRLAGVSAGFAGVALVVLSREDTPQLRAGIGELVVLGALLTFVCGGAIVQRLAVRLDALTIGWTIYAFGTVALLAHATVTGATASLRLGALDGWTWALVLYSGVLGTAVSNVGWYHAIATVGMAKAAVFLSWLPIFGVGFAVVMLGEELTAWHIAGLVLVIAGTRLGTMPVR